MKPALQDPDPARFGFLCSIIPFHFGFISSCHRICQRSSLIKPKVHALVLAVASLVLPANAFDMDWVSVGDINNPADPAPDNPSNPVKYGAVDHTYNIGKYEVTNAQYVEFLNAVDLGGSNPYSLYIAEMAGPFGGINFNSSASSGSKYSVIAGRGNKPVNWVSWYDAARMANWMHNGQGSGSTETGAYNLYGATSGTDFSVQPGARVWLPSEDEWYKAAYYDPTTGAGGGDNYWRYPTRSDSEPSNDLVTPDPGNNANFSQGGYTTGDILPFTTNVGEFENSSSYYGTFDQGGNLREWNDAVIGGSGRGIRGGMWTDSSVYLMSSMSGGLSPEVKYNNLGFRLASVPEPSGVLLALFGCMGAVLARRRRA